MTAVLPCPSCGYDLRAAPIGALCPECGLDIDLHYSRERTELRAWRVSMRTASWMTVTAASISLVVFAVMVAVVLLESSQPGPAVIAVVTLHTLGACDLVFLAIANLAVNLPPRHGQSRTLATIAWLQLLAALVLIPMCCGWAIAPSIVIPYLIVVGSIPLVTAIGLRRAARLWHADSIVPTTIVVAVAAVLFLAFLAGPLLWLLRGGTATPGAASAAALCAMMSLSQWLLVPAFGSIRRSVGRSERTSSARRAVTSDSRPE